MEDKEIKLVTVLQHNLPSWQQIADRKEKEDQDERNDDGETIAIFWSRGTGRNNINSQW
jgi:hypothetical protein